MSDIGTKRTSEADGSMSVIGGKADIPFYWRNVSFWPQSGHARFRITAVRRLARRVFDL